VGVLEFGRGVSLGGILDEENYHIVVRIGERACQPRHSELSDPISGLLVTKAKQAKYCRNISEDGIYSHNITCDFDEQLDFAWPVHDRHADIVADVWLERTSPIDRFDSFLKKLGINETCEGSERLFLGRAVADLPPEGVADAAFAWPVEASECITGCPVPKTVSLAVDWKLDVKDPTKI
jgi:hypothetical protein